MRWFPPVSYTHLDVYKRQLLERHGYAFNELDLGKREPVTEEEKLFVAVCRGEREPVTEAERVWSTYMTCLLYTSRCV